VGFPKDSYLQKEACRIGDEIKRCNKLFTEWKKDPFSQALGVHKIHRLSSLAGECVRAVHVEKNFIVTFAVRGNEIISLDMGTHRELYGRD